MGLWNTIGKGIDYAGRLGDIFSGAASGLSQGRQDDNLNALRAYQLALQQAQQQFNNDQTNYQNQLTAPSTRADQARRGDLQANVQDIQFQLPEGSTIPLFGYTGGIRPSALGPNARQAGSEMSRNALLRMMQGEPYPQYQAPVAPTINSGGGRLENILGGLGLGSSIVGGVNPPNSRPY